MTQKCIKCKRLNQIFTCKGCQQSFCDEHITEHREELSYQMNNITKEYHYFEEELNGKDIIQSYLSRIDHWEHESIDKIQKTAEIARNDLLKIHDRTKKQLQSSFDKINRDLQSNRDFKNYTEINLNQWIEQLKQLRHLHKTSFTDDIIDDHHSSLQLIKIIDKNSSLTSEELHFSPHEKFAKTVGEITLLKDRFTATCSGSKWNGSNVSGTNLYSSGIHSIRFRLTKKGKNNLFFGITSSIKESNPWNRKTPFAYGWWDLPLNDDNDKQENLEDQNIRTGDEVTLTLDCTNDRIEFEHHRTNRYIDQSITKEQCPFPWKIALVLYSPGDSVSILS